MPQRIRLSRAKGWRLPEGAVNVARPTRWGNPFPLSLGRERCIDLYREALRKCWTPWLLDDLGDEEFHAAYVAQQKWVERFKCGYGAPIDDVKRELRGKDLACWCSLDDACHADVLLEIANS